MADLGFKPGVPSYVQLQVATLGLDAGVDTASPIDMLSSQGPENQKLTSPSWVSLAQGGIAGV